MKTLLNKGPIKRYFSMDFGSNALSRLQRPLYYYILGLNAAVFAMWKSGIIDTSFMKKNFTLT